MPAAQINQLKIEYECFGSRRDPSVLLIMGLGSQMVLWPQALCEQIAAQGFHVIRFDNRDVGLSSKLDHLGVPPLALTALRGRLGMPARVPYRLEDMAADAVGLLNALDIERAHIVGCSMGGMIAQLLAAQWPHRCLSLTGVMTSSGNPALPGPPLSLRLRMLRRRPLDPESAVRHGMQFWRMVGGREHVPSGEELRRRVLLQLQRGTHPPGVARQLAAILAAPSRVALLREIQLPALVIHGSDDPLIPVAAAVDLARHLPRARLEIIPGLGHELPEVLVPETAQLLLDHFQTNAAARPSQCQRSNNVGSSAVAQVHATA